MTARHNVQARRPFMVIKALALFIIIDIGFRTFGFRRLANPLLTRARRLGRDRRPGTDLLEVGRQTFDAVCVATRYYYRRRLDCLPKALTTHYLLLAQGVGAELCLGVRTCPFAGHAWVEVGGERLDDSPSVKYRAGAYTVLERLS